MLVRASLSYYSSTRHWQPQAQAGHNWQARWRVLVSRLRFILVHTTTYLELTGRRAVPVALLLVAEVAQSLYAGYAAPGLTDATEMFHAVLLLQFSASL